MQLPRVLIFGQPFNNRYGGGITLTNLFTGWDRDRIAVAATGHVMYHVTTDVCDTYYQLGIEEFKWHFPFNLVQRKFTSGVIGFEKNKEFPKGKTKSHVRQTVVDKVFYPFLEWLGVFHGLARIKMTTGLKKWLSEFQPDIIYLQVSTRDTILFGVELIDYLKVPSVIHIMDDWPSTISKKGLLRKYWHKKIDGEFRRLLSKVDQCLSISEAMSAGYKKRYGKEFEAFHNPIDIQAWTTATRKNYNLNTGHIKVLFSGRIGIGVSESLLDIGTVIEALSQQGLKIKLHIQTTSSNSKVLNEMAGFKSLVINPVAEYSQLPSIFSDADILVIANDFDDESINYLRYSMPTKASEYMISGTPIIVYSHEATAVSKFFINNRCGHCVTERNLTKLGEAFTLLIDHEEYRQEIGKNAVAIAAELFDAAIVRSRFQDLLSQTSLKKQMFDSEECAYRSTWQ